MIIFTDFGITGICVASESIVLPAAWRGGTQLHDLERFVPAAAITAKSLDISVSLS
jgi:hypothetical protein